MMSITGQWFVFGGITIAMFLVGLLWPRSERGNFDTKQEHTGATRGTLSEKGAEKRGEQSAAYGDALSR